MAKIKKGLVPLPANIQKRALNNNKEADKVISNKTLTLSEAFNWSESKEGFEY